MHEEVTGMTDREIREFADDPIGYVARDIRNGKGLLWLAKLVIATGLGLALLGGAAGFVALLSLI
jgi:hypothetical protein